jgi:hypothetical protein
MDVLCLKCGNPLDGDDDSSKCPHCGAYQDKVRLHHEKQEAEKLNQEIKNISNLKLQKQELSKLINEFDGSYCSGCGSLLSNEDSFCTGCGNPTKLTSLEGELKLVSDKLSQLSSAVKKRPVSADIVPSKLNEIKHEKVKLVPLFIGFVIFSFIVVGLVGRDSLPISNEELCSYTMHSVMAGDTGSNRYQCNVSGDTITWRWFNQGHWGRWRDTPYDSIITYSISGNKLTIIERGPDGGVNRDTYTINR